ncbi:hypothetical protein [Nocardia sp. NPDC050710]|uniref:hypothetical protein n=1 Tax=Nocardia sp. NPDC050710 TaxID=3157220 RepID=UPI0033C4F95F
MSYVDLLTNANLLDAQVWSEHTVWSTALDSIEARRGGGGGGGGVYDIASVRGCGAVSERPGPSG